MVNKRKKATRVSKWYYSTLGRLWFNIAYHNQWSYYFMDRFVAQPESCHHVRNSFFQTRCLPTIFNYYEHVRHNCKIVDFRDFAQQLIDLFGERLVREIKKHKKNCKASYVDGQRRRRSLKSCLADIVEHMTSARLERRQTREMWIRSIQYRYNPHY